MEYKKATIHFDQPSGGAFPVVRAFMDQFAPRNERNFYAEGVCAESRSNSVSITFPHGYPKQDFVDGIRAALENAGSISPERFTLVTWTHANTNRQVRPLHKALVELVDPVSR